MIQNTGSIIIRTLVLFLYVFPLVKISYITQFPLFHNGIDTAFQLFQ